MLGIAMVLWAFSGHLMWLRAVLDDNDEWGFPLDVVLGVMLLTWLLGPVGWFLRYYPTHIQYVVSYKLTKLPKT